MGKKYSIEYDEDITIVRFFGEPGLEEIVNAIEDVAENFPSEFRIWDFNSGFNLTTAQLEQLAIYSKSKLLSSSKVAIVAPEDLAYGVSNIYSVFRAEDLIAQRVFRSEPEARAWLKR